MALTSLQATGNVIISCVQAAHEKYQSNPPDWHDVIVRGWRLLTKRDMRKFKNLCEDGLLGPGDYGIFEDWSAINNSQKKYIHIKDRLILEGEVQDMNDEEFFYNEGPYKECVRGFSWHTTRWLLNIAGSHFARQTLGIFVSLR
jgi:hypothetical protein